MAPDTQRIKAYCPGHVTGIFTVEDDAPDVLDKGSRGLGFCTELGAISEICFSPGDGRLDIRINSRESNAEVTRSAIEYMVPKLSLDLIIDIQLQAPTGHGFGMSAAGTFATCLGTAHYLGLPHPMLSALHATHIAEVEHGSGLGDAMAMATGGFVHRKNPGAHSIDNAVCLDNKEREILFCILGEELKTRDIIQTPGWKTIIRNKGASALSKWQAQPTFENFLQLSNEFSQATGLMTEEMGAVLEELPGGFSGSMVMLGNSVFVTGPDIGEIHPTLDKHGTVVKTRITSQTPRII